MQYLGPTKSLNPLRCYMTGAARLCTNLDFIPPFQSHLSAPKKYNAHSSLFSSLFQTSFFSS